jgi:hypothetical protein
LPDRQGDQLRVAGQRRPTATGRDRELISEDVGCNDKGFQIRHLELLSRGDTVWKPFVFFERVPADPPDFHIKPLAAVAAIAAAAVLTA